MRYEKEYLNNHSSGDPTNLKLSFLRVDSRGQILFECHW